MRNTRLATITKEEYRRNITSPPPPTEPEPEVISDFESSVEPEILDKSEPEINSKKQK
jgi:hypothetical protein